MHNTRYAAAVIGIAIASACSSAFPDERMKLLHEHTVQHKSPMRFVFFGPMNDVVYSVCAAGVVRCTNLRTGEGHVALNVSPLSACAISADGRFLATSVAAGIEVWDIPSRERVLLTEVDGGVYDLAFSCDGKLVAVAGADGILVVNCRDHAAAIQLEPTELVRGHVDTVQFRRNGDLIAGYSDHRIAVWDVVRRREVSILGDRREGAIAGVVDLEVFGDGKRIGAAHYQRGAEIWNLDRSELERSTTEHIWSASCVAYRAHNDSLAVAVANTIHIVSSSVYHVETVPKHSESISSIAFSPDGRYFVTGSLDGEGMIWRVVDE